MHSVAILSALLAVGTSVVSGVSTCSDDILISEPTPVIDCDVIEGNVKVAEGVAGSLSIEGPKQLKKDMVISNATKLLGVSSSSINSIGGALKLNGLELLSSFNMQALKSVHSLELVNLPQLSQPTFGSDGVTKVKSIVITDTFISDLVGFNTATADSINIANNAKLTRFVLDIVNITHDLKLTNNGNNMEVNMSKLETAGDVQFRQVKSFDAPVLRKVSSIKFNDSPELLSVTANNLTDISESLTFINNKKISQVQFLALKTIGGDMTVQNNTQLQALSGFPHLTTCGNILLRGTFEQVKLPSLKDVKGSATATSTTDISDFCKFFSDLKSHGDIRGKMSCTSNNKNAIDSDGNNSTNSGKEKDAAGILNVNTALLSVVAFAVAAQLLL